MKDAFKTAASAMLASLALLPGKTVAAPIYDTPSDQSTPEACGVIINQESVFFSQITVLNPNFSRAQAGEFADNSWAILQKTPSNVISSTIDVYCLRRPSDGDALYLKGHLLPALPASAILFPTGTMAARQTRAALAQGAEEGYCGVYHRTRL